MVRKPDRGSKSPSRAEARALETRRAILRAGARAFRARGFAATGMREIAEAAGISTANLYYYFAGKQEILYFCQDHSLDRLLAAARALEGSALPPADRLRELIRVHLVCTLDELDGAAAHLELDALPAPLRTRVVRKRDRYERAVRDLVSEGIAAGTFSALDPALVTRAMLGALNWTARWFRPEGPSTPAQLADVYSNYLLGGLLAWNGSRSRSASTGKRPTSASPATRRSSRSSAKTSA
jgi:AcrR family transcriptional regulator